MKIKWERHGDIWMLRSNGWAQAFLSLVGNNGSSYCCVTTSTGCIPVREFFGGSIRRLKAEVVAFIKAQ